VPATTVQSRELDATGQGIAGLRVSARLLGPSDWLSDHSGEVASPATTATAEDGTWSLSLTPQSDYDAADTHYGVTINGSTYACVVPDDGPVQLYDILIDPQSLQPVAPTSPPLYLLRTEVGTVVPPLVDGKVPLAFLPPAGSEVPSWLVPWKVAQRYAGLTVPESSLTPHPDNNPDNAIEVPAGAHLVGLHIVCSELLCPSDDFTVENCWIETDNADYGIRLDANTGQETGRNFVHCKVTATGRAFAGGSGTRLRLCEVVDHGDDAFQFGRTHAQGPTLEYCYVHDTRPQPGAHADGLQQLAPPAADVHLWGCYIDLTPAAGYTIPPNTGYTGAIFLDPDDGGIPVGDPEPGRIGTVYVDWCYLKSPQNYSVVIGAHAKVQITNCTIVSGTSGFESVDPAATVYGWGNTDEAGVPLSDTAFSAFPDTVQPSTGGSDGGTKVAWRGARITSGSLNPPASSNGAWAALMQSDGLTPFEISIPAADGDLLTAAYNWMFKASDANTHFDLGIVVGTTIVRFSASGTGTPAAEGDPGSYSNGVDFKPHASAWEFEVDQTDLDGEQLRVCVVYKGGSGIFYAENDYQFRWSLKNEGQHS
jgi:hypothetical protein